MNPVEVERTIYHHRGDQETGWCFWENYRLIEKQDKGQKGQADKNFQDTLEKVYSFKNLEEFLIPWKHHNWEDSSTILYNILDETEKRVIRGEKLYAIETLNLFREGVHPSWEDENNQYGYDLRVELEVSADQRDQTERIYKDLW